MWVFPTSLNKYKNISKAEQLIGWKKNIFFPKNKFGGLEKLVRETR